jgi:MFS family permease
MAASGPTPEKDTNRSIGQRISEGYKEVAETFVNLIRAPRALWGINVSYFFEGLVYFGILTILGKYLSEDVGLADLHAGWVYSVFTGGITLAMLFLGGVSDRIGVPRALMLALGLMVGGRVLLAGSGTFFEYGQGAGSPMFFMVAAGLFVVMIGYGMYQPAAYAGVKLYTNKKTAAIGYAMVYAVMNLGAFFSGIISPPVRQASGMVGVYWVYVGFTILAFLAVAVILTRRVAADAMARVKREDEEAAAEEKDAGGEAKKDATTTGAASAAPARSVFEPLTLVLGLATAIAIALLIQRFTAAEAPPVEAALDAHGKRAGRVARAIGDLLGEVPDAAAFSAVTADLAKAATATAGGITAPKDSPHPVDRAAFSLVTERLRLDGAFTWRALEGRQAALGLPLELTPEQAAAKRALLRAHAVRLMTMAYALVEPVDRAVVDNQRARLKLPDEPPIPMDEAAIEALLAHTAAAPEVMLAGLADDLKRLSGELFGDLPPEAREIVGADLTAEQRFAARAAQVVGATPGEAARAVLIEGLLADAQTALARAGVFAPGGQEAPRLGALVTPRFQYEAASMSGLSEALSAALAVPLGARAGAWFWRYGVYALAALVLIILLSWRLLHLRPEHPFHDGRFTFFIFVLIPVQTLFAHNWLTLPYYIDRAFGGTTVGANFEFFSNLNPILIFVLTPLVAALTARKKVYTMLIAGTLVMALPTFLLALPPSAPLLLTYITLMSIGEAMWQPRFLQYIAEIAPEGKTGAYMGIGQLPWFLTKLVTGTYSGWFLANHVPRVGPQSPEMLWLIYAFIAMISPVVLIFAKRWMAQDENG